MTLPFRFTDILLDYYTIILYNIIIKKINNFARDVQRSIAYRVKLSVWMNE